jgi:predicted nucleotidyltransferase component of viral defense system
MLVSNLSEADRRTLYGEIERQKHISAAAVEKDWWVTIVLHALFSTEYAAHMVFKGGTSLSKS